MRSPTFGMCNCCFASSFDGAVDKADDMHRFHISTAYDILRHKGVPLGKLDFLNGAGLIKFSTLPPKPE